MGTPRQAMEALRNRYVFLQSKNSVTRGEALQKAELSDMLDIKLKLPPELSIGGNPDPMHISIFKIADGKTNKNSDVVYGCAIRHKCIDMCPLAR
jgi:hypothetical protein